MNLFSKFYVDAKFGRREFKSTQQEEALAYFQAHQPGAKMYMAQFLNGTQISLNDWTEWAKTQPIVK